MTYDLVLYTKEKSYTYGNDQHEGEKVEEVGEKEDGQEKEEAEGAGEKEEEAEGG